jgi:hypothetical protein
VAERKAVYDLRNIVSIVLPETVVAPRLKPTVSEKYDSSHPPSSQSF